jgi:hypothetical protein
MSPSWEITTDAETTAGAAGPRAGAAPDDAIGT